MVGRYLLYAQQYPPPEPAQNALVAFDAEDMTAQAQRLLREAKASAASDPNWFRAMLILSFVAHEPQSVRDALLQEANTRWPTFYENDFASILTMVLPDDDSALPMKLERATQAAVRRTRKHDGQSAYARMYWYVADSYTQTGVFALTDASWTEMKRGFVDLVAKYPDSRNISAFARFACLARDRRVARKLFERFGDIIDIVVWRSDLVANECRTWAQRDAQVEGIL